MKNTIFVFFVPKFRKRLPIHRFKKMTWSFSLNFYELTPLASLPDIKNKNVDHPSQTSDRAYYTQNTGSSYWPGFFVNLTLRQIIRQENGLLIPQIPLCSHKDRTEDSPPLSVSDRIVVWLLKADIELTPISGARFGDKKVQLIHEFLLPITAFK